MGLLPLENGPQDHLFRGKLEQLFRLVITHSGKTQMDFAALMGTNRSNVARWILQLERMELISRAIIPGTARTYGIHLTSHGRALALNRRFLALDGHDGHDGHGLVDGAHGLDGHAGRDGTHRRDGVDGQRDTDGAGSDGRDGVDGVDAVDGVEGMDGADVVDGHAGSDGAADHAPRAHRRSAPPPAHPTLGSRRTVDGQRPAKGRRRR